MVICLVLKAVWGLIHNKSARLLGRRDRRQRLEVAEDVQDAIRRTGIPKKYWNIELPQQEVWDIKIGSEPDDKATKRGGSL